MHLVPIDLRFQASHPWRTLLNLYRPDRRRMGLAVITANIIDSLAHPGPDTPRQLALKAVIGGLAIFQNVFMSTAYVRQFDRDTFRRHLAVVRPLDLLARPESRFARPHTALGEGTA